MDFVFNIPAFRISYPAFADSTAWPDATLQMFWDSAICIISPTNYGWLNGNNRYTALTLLTAHLAALSVIIASGQVPGLVQAAGIDKVNVSLTPPPLENQFQWWLSLTPYGANLFAILQVNSVGGFIIGGFPVRSAVSGRGYFF